MMGVMWWEEEGAGNKAVAQNGGSVHSPCSHRDMLPR